MIASAVPTRYSITKFQERIYRFIRRYYRVNRTGPHVNLLSRAFGIQSPHEAANHVRVLETRGFLCWDRVSFESIRPCMTFMEDRMVDLPIRETELLSAISEWCLKQGEMPTWDELADSLSYPVEDVIKVARKLQRRGLLAYQQGPRSLSINTKLAFPGR